MTSSQLALECARIAIDKKAERVQILDLRGINAFAEYFVICSAFSDRQVRAIAEAILESPAGRISRQRVEGLDTARWVLLDFGDVVVHVFMDAIRDYYRLEDLWQGAPRLPIPSEFHGHAATRMTHTHE